MNEQKPDTVEQLRIDVRHDIRCLWFMIYLSSAAIVVLALAVGDWF